MPKPSPMADKEKLASAISVSRSKLEVLTFLGLRAAGGNYKQLSVWADRHGLTLPSGVGNHQTKQARLSNILPDELVFCENSQYRNRSALKKRLRKVWTSWVCASCGIGEEWNGLPLVLQLEHRNGVWNDNRLDNLCLLCPNCHSQTPTFAGRKLGTLR